MLTVIDELTRECLALEAARRLKSDDILHSLAGLFADRGPPRHIRSYNGPKFVARAVREWLGRMKGTTLYIEPGSPWKNGYNESFKGKLRDELLDREIFYSFREVQILIERWRKDYNMVRPHSARGYRPPGAGRRYPWRSKAEQTNFVTGIETGVRSIALRWVGACCSRKKACEAVSQH